MADISKEQLKQKLMEAIKTFERKTLAHYLHFESSDRKLKQDIKNSIKDKYGFEKFMPAIDWKETFGNYADSDLLDQEINRYLESVNYSEETFIMPMDRLKNMLWNNARKNGQEILSQYSS